MPRTNRDDVTLKDIAEAVGKSVAAVSRALNNYEDISPETREHIKRVAREMGYAPTDTLGLVLPTPSARTSDPYFGELLASITSEAASQGFDLLVSTCPADVEENRAYLRLINSRKVDGFIVIRPRRRDARIEMLREKQFPFVVVGATNVAGQVYSVAVDEAKGAQQVVAHLVAQGHQQIALINTPADLMLSLNYLAGFQQAMQHAGLPINTDYLTNSDFSQKDGYRIAHRLLNLSQPPTAIVATDDLIALGVMSAVQDQGLEVGSDVAVAGFGDILLAEYSKPPLTSVRRSAGLLGQKACQMLISRLRNEPVAQQNVVIQPSLVIRQSTDLALWL
ncbi:MAG: LacI family transcriptional regulator [Chloroflexi bacterium]|nr:MAG: LacI family transcriptional regulator [Chloroflexota bacterium]